MSNKLAIYEKKGVSLVDIRKDFNTFPRLNTIPRELALPQMCKVVTMAFLYKGNQADKQNIEFIASALLDELLYDDTGYGTKFITFEEITRIVKRAVLSTEMFGVSVSNLYKVIVEYCKGEGAEASRKARGSLATTNPIIDQVKPMLTAYVGEMLRKK